MGDKLGDSIFNGGLVENFIFAVRFMFDIFGTCDFANGTYADQFFVESCADGGEGLREELVDLRDLDEELELDDELDDLDTYSGIFLQRWVTSFLRCPFAHFFKHLLDPIG